VKNEQLRHVIADRVLEVLRLRGNDSEIRLQVAALAGSLDDTLSDEAILAELKALKAGRPTFNKVFEDNSAEH
jgi:hypothetical protein